MDIELDRNEALAYNHNHSFSKIVILNEAVTGQSEVYVMNSMRYLNEKFNIEFQNFHIILTGLKKKVYNQVFKINTEEYVKLFINAYHLITKYLADQGFAHEIFMYLYFNTKQICILFNRGDHTEREVNQCAEFINSLLQRIYEQEIFKGNQRYVNFTILSPLIKTYSLLAGEFARIQELEKLSFFYTESRVITEEKLLVMKNDFTYSKAQQLLEELTHSIVAGEKETCKQLNAALFDQMACCYDLSLCWEIGAELKKQVYQYNLIFDLNLENEIDSKFKLSSHANIKEMYASIDRILQICVGGARQKGRGISYISQKALKYIKENYEKNISLNDIASHVKVVPTYLSEVFNRELGMSIPQYLIRMRIEKSKKLLGESDLKIYEIACSVGMNHANYFSRIFKKYEGTTPQQYKEKMRKLQIELDTATSD